MKNSRLTAQTKSSWNPMVGRECDSPVALAFEYSNLFSPRHRQAFTEAKRSRRIPTTCESCLETKVLIVGGGIHGFGLLAQLVAWGKRCTADVMLIDRGEYLCGAFIDGLDAISQTILRSPYDHQLAPDGITQMTDIARMYFEHLEDSEREQLDLALASCRSIVPLDVFECHINHVANVLSLKSFCLRDSVERVYPQGGSYTVDTASGRQIQALRVVFATGGRERARRSPNPVRSTGLSKLQEKAVVHGGGVSAAHLICSDLGDYAAIEWRLRHQLVFRCSDVPHEYFRTEGLVRFSRLAAEDRADELVRAMRSTVMPEYRDHLVGLVAAGRLSILVSDDHLCEHDVDADHFTLCGFEAEDAIYRLLPFEGGRAEVVDDTLEISQFRGTYVTGWLAVPSVGPSAKNIDGVRICSERILPALGVAGGRGSVARTYSGWMARPLITGSAPISGLTASDSNRLG